ncbi:MAG: ribonuclease J [Patescibacteria group bacterium]|nr:ribonuclease J [Patescibacteria group bacterium]
MNNQISFIPLGGVGDVTRNMYLYETENEILIIDCGLGFADEAMLGVDLLLPDISYLLKTTKKIVGMVLTHGHEDHIGALPYILPQLPIFPILGTPLTAALANEKLKEFNVASRVKTVLFDEQEKILGSFKISFIRVTHSVPDASNLLIKTKEGNFYHGSDFKFDLTPIDGKKTEFQKIVNGSSSGITCLMSDCLGSERKGYTPSEQSLSESFEREAQICRGKILITTYSSNISRLNQAIKAGENVGRKICFVGRSLIKAKEVAQRLGYLKINNGSEVQIEDLKRHNEKRLLLIVAGSQGQENSAMTRIANDEHREIKLNPQDTVIFSTDPIPGNEISVNDLIDTIAKRGARVVYSDISDDFHVSGHGSSQDIMLLISLVKPKYFLPIGGTFRHMVAYRSLCEKLGYKKDDVFLVDDGQEIVFSQNKAYKGKKIDIKNVYVDQISGEEVEGFVLRDRQKLSEGGLVILLTEVSSSTGAIVNTPTVIIRGFPQADINILGRKLENHLKNTVKVKAGGVTDWIYIRKLIGEVSERFIFKELHRHPLVLPVVIKV